MGLRLPAALILLGLFLSVAAVVATAQEESTGVSGDDVFSYSISAHANPDTPNATIQPAFLETNKATHCQITVRNASASMVSYIPTVRFSNGSETTFPDASLDLETGESSFFMNMFPLIQERIAGKAFYGSYFISPKTNLTVRGFPDQSDIVYPAGSGSLGFRGVHVHEYPSGVKRTESDVADQTNRTRNGWADYYFSFDRESGALTGATFYDQQDNTSYTVYMQLVETSVWEVGEYRTPQDLRPWTALGITMFGAASTTIVVWRKKYRNRRLLFVFALVCLIELASLAWLVGDYYTPQLGILHMSEIKYQRHTVEKNGTDLRVAMKLVNVGNTPGKLDRLWLNGVPQREAVGLKCTAFENVAYDGVDSFGWTLNPGGGVMVYLTLTGEAGCGNMEVRFTVTDPYGPPCIAVLSLP